MLHFFPFVHLLFDSVQARSVKFNTWPMDLSDSDLSDFAVEFDDISTEDALTGAL